MYFIDIKKSKKIDEKREKYYCLVRDEWNEIISVIDDVILMMIQILDDNTMYATIQDKFDRQYKLHIRDFSFCLEVMKKQRRSCQNYINFDFEE